MNVFYGVQMTGQGHLNRASELIRRLRARGHHVRVMTSGGRPPEYAREVLGAFEHVPAPSLSITDGKLDLLRDARDHAAAIPSRLARAASLSRELVRARIDAVLTDFEPISAWAGKLARIPTFGVSSQYRLTRTDAAHPAVTAPSVSGVMSMSASRTLAAVRGRAARSAVRAAVRMCSPALDHYFAVSFAPLRPTRRRTTVTGPIVDHRVRALRPSRAGFVLAYLYGYRPAVAHAALTGAGPIRVYGLGERGRDGDVTYLATDRDSFIRDLAACDGVILGGSFQLACEAAALGKPMLSIPFAAQYEEAFSALQIERAGLGMAAPALTRDAVAQFAAWRAERPVSAPLASDGAAEVLAALGL